jgi:hypothetical protein
MDIDPQGSFYAERDVTTGEVRIPGGERLAWMKAATARPWATIVDAEAATQTIALDPKSHPDLAQLATTAGQLAAWFWTNHHVNTGAELTPAGVLGVLRARTANGGVVTIPIAFRPEHRALLDGIAEAALVNVTTWPATFGTMRWSLALYRNVIRDCIAKLDLTLKQPNAASQN